MGQPNPRARSKLVVVAAPRLIPEKPVTSPAWRGVYFEERGEARMKRYHPLGAELNLWYHRSVADLPERLRLRLRTMKPIALAIWDDLTPAQRRQLVTEQIDPAYDPAGRRDQLIGFRAAWADLRHRNIAQRNRNNSQLPRPGRQKLSDAEILRLKRQLANIPLHKNLSEARRLLAKKGIKVSLRGLRKRWNHPRLSSSSKG